MLAFQSDSLIEEITEETKKKRKAITYQFVTEVDAEYKNDERTPAARTARRLYVQSLIEEWLTTGHNLAMIYDNDRAFTDSYAMFQSFLNVCKREFAGEVTAFLETTQVSKKRLLEVRFGGSHAQPLKKKETETHKDFRFVPSLGREAYVTVRHDRQIADVMSHWSLRQSRYKEEKHAEYQVWLCRVNPIIRGAGIKTRYDGSGKLEDWASKLYRERLKVVDE